MWKDDSPQRKQIIGGKYMNPKKYAQEVVKEGKRVRWPKREQFIPALIAAVVICVFCALVLSLEDWVAGTLIEQLKSVFGTGNTAGEVATEISLWRMF